VQPAALATKLGPFSARHRRCVADLSSTAHWDNAQFRKRCSSTSASLPVALAAGAHLPAIFSPREYVDRDVRCLTRALVAEERASIACMDHLTHGKFAFAVIER